MMHDRRSRDIYSPEGNTDDALLVRPGPHPEGKLVITKLTMSEGPASSQQTPYQVYSSLVARDPTDFIAWSKLLAIVEDFADARTTDAFEKFLATFPLCFGYWCKYADLQPRLKSAEAGARQREVYERAVRAVPLSVELWKSYCAYARDNRAPPAELRSIYERAVEAVGRDAQAAALWDSYLEHEADHGTPATVCGVYRLMLGRESGRSDELWRRFKVLCKSFKTNELVSPEEARDLLARFRAAKNLEAEDDAREGLAGYSALAEQRQLEQMLTETEAAKNEVVQRRVERQPFEAGIRRWYFHVKPLDEAQLQNWRDYLAKEMTRAKADVGAKADVRRLFERCLVPCALYAEFWIKYAYWTRLAFSVEEALAVVGRAASTFLPKRVDVLECHALLLEAAGRVEEARRVLDRINVATLADPASRASCSIARANFERRCTNHSGVLEAYRETLARAEPGFEAVAAHAARYLVRVRRDDSAARAVLDDA